MSEAVIAYINDKIQYYNCFAQTPTIGIINDLEILKSLIDKVTSNDIPLLRQFLRDNKVKGWNLMKEEKALAVAQELWYGK